MTRQIDKHVSIHYTRIPVVRITLTNDSVEQFDMAPMLKAARLLADAGVDSIIWNGTSASWLGLEMDRQLCAAITDATGVKAGTSTLALFDALHLYDVNRIGLVVPYTDDVTDQIVKVYGSEGIACVARSAAGLTENTQIGAVSADSVYDRIGEVAIETAEAAAVVCTNFRGAPVVQKAEDRCGIPVFDSVTLALWDGMRHARVSNIIHGWGTLLETGMFRAAVGTVLSSLCEDLHADRTTLRLDIPELHLNVNTPCAEQRRPDIPSLRREGSLDQRSLDTVRWMDANRRMLVQGDLNTPPRAPQALIEKYGVKAQVLCPIIRGSEMIGWISAHSATEREWSSEDQRHVSNAVHAVGTILDGDRADTAQPEYGYRPTAVAE